MTLPNIPAGWVQPALSFAVFDEFGNGADDRVQNYGRACADAVLNAAPKAPDSSSVHSVDASIQPLPLEAASPQGSATASEREMFQRWLLTTRQKGRGFDDMERADLCLMFPGHWEAWQARASLDAAAQRPIAAAESKSTRQDEQEVNPRKTRGGLVMAAEAIGMRFPGQVGEPTALEAAAKAVIDRRRAALALQQEPKP